MSDGRLDFSALDPTRDSERQERIVARIMLAAAHLLAARRLLRSPVRLITTWRRPILAAAAVVVLISGVVRERVPASPEAPSRALGLVEALGVPSAVADWVAAHRAPTPAQLFTWLVEAR